MRMSFKKIRDIVEKALLQNSVIVSGRVHPEGIRVTKSVTCPQEDKPIIMDQFYSIGSGLIDVPRVTNLTSTLDAKIVVDEWSHDFITRVVVRSGADSDIFLEVYRDDQVVFKKNLKDKHGTFCAKEPFNKKPLIFNTQGNKCLYLAEIKPLKADIWADEFKSSHLRGNEYKHHFGESCDDAYNLGVFLIDLKALTVLRVKGMPKDIIPITACFIEDQTVSVDPEEILITGYESSRFLSGINMCLNKPSALYVVSKYEIEDLFPKNNDAKMSKEKDDEDKKKEEQKEEKPAGVKKITEFPIVMFPSVSPSGKRVVYFFSRHFNETHLFTTGLVVHDIDSGKSEVIVDSEEPSDKDRSFYVFYEAFHHLTWISEDEIAFPAYDLGRCVLYFVNLKTKSRKMIVLSTEFETENVRVLDCTTDSLLLAKSNFYCRSKLGVAKGWKDWRYGDAADQTTQIAWEKKIVEDRCEHRFQQGEIEETKISVRDVTGFIWYMKSYRDEHGSEVPREKRPLYVHFHGGPHYFSGANYSTLALILMKQGYQFMTLNFSGSWSFGKDFNERLCGKVGELDIDELVDWMKANTDQYDPASVTFDGGSYSGLQSIVLLQKHHSLFKNIIAYNPVVNMVSNFYQTDIPEWNLVEALGTGRKYNVDEDLTDEDILKMKKLSPALQHFDKDTKTKVLLIIGDKDKRVPPSAGFYLFRKLKAIGIDIRCLSYKDQGHGIRKPSFVMDYLMNVFDTIFDFEGIEKIAKHQEQSTKVKEIVVKEMTESDKATEERQLQAANVADGEPTTSTI